MKTGTKVEKAKKLEVKKAEKEMVGCTFVPKISKSAAKKEQ